MGSRALKQALNARGVDIRLQAREAIAGLAVKEIQAQSLWSVEHLAGQAGPQQLEGLLKDLFAKVKDCTPAVRKLRYRLVARVLRLHATRHPGQALLFVRDRVAERVGHEDSATAAELHGVMQQLTHACIDAYCNAHFSALGVASKEDLPRAWLCSLLIMPLLGSVGRSSAKTKMGNACLLVAGVLAALKKWSKSAAALHAAVECLKELLKLTGTVALTASEVFLPIQSCITLLGQRLRAAAVQAILRMAVAGMAKEDWQVRKAAAETLTQLVCGLRLPQQAQGGAAGQQGGQVADSGQTALLQAQLPLLAAVEQHIKYDRIPQVRQAATALIQELQSLSPLPAAGVDGDFNGGVQGQHRPQAVGRQEKQLALTGPPPRWVSPGRQRSSPPRFERPHISPERQASLVFEVFAPPTAPAAAVTAAAGGPGDGRQRLEVQGQQQRQEGGLKALPETVSSLVEVPPPPYNQPPAGSSRSSASSAQGTVHHVIHPLFNLQLQGDLPSGAAVHITPSGVEHASLAAVVVRLEGSCLEVEVGVQSRPGGPVITYPYTLQGGQLQQHTLPAEEGRLMPQPMSAQPPAPAAHYTPAWPPAPAAAPAGGERVSSPSGGRGNSPCDEGRSSPSGVQIGNPYCVEDGSFRGGLNSSPTRLGKLAAVDPPAAGRSSVEMDGHGMSSPTKQWVESLRPLDSFAPLLRQPGEGSGALSGSRSQSPSPQSPSRRQVSSPSGKCRGMQSPGHASLPSSHPASPHRPVAKVGWQSSSRPQSPGRPAETAATAAAGHGGLPAVSNSSGDVWTTPQRCPPQEQQTPAVQSPFSRAPSSLGQPLCCESPPIQQQLGPPGGNSKQKGPLTAIVTKALSRLQQLQELQQWEEAVSQQLSAGPGHASPGSDSGSVRQAEVAAHEPEEEEEEEQQPGPWGGTAQADARYAKRSLQPKLSAIAEATTEGGGSSSNSMASGGGGGAPEEIASQDDELGRLLEYQSRLEAKMREVQARIGAPPAGLVSSSADKIPAAWPQPTGSPGRRESDTSSLGGELGDGVQYSAGSQRASRWQDNPTFNSSRPGTAMSTRDSPTKAPAARDELTAASEVAAAGPQRQGSLHSPPSLSGWSLGPTQSLGSELGLAGGPTEEEEIHAFLRGSIPHPATQQHPARPPSRGAVRTSHSSMRPAAAGGMGAERPPRPPPPHVAGRGSVGEHGSQPARRERQRWAHLSAGSPPSPLQQRPASPSSIAAGQRGAHSPGRDTTARNALALMRGSLDLDAILDSSCEASPQASCAGSDCGDGRELDGKCASGFGRHASANLERLPISSRPASPAPADSIEEAVRGSISQVLHATFPDAALDRLDRLRARLSPSEQPQGASRRRSASPQQAPRQTGGNRTASPVGGQLGPSSPRPRPPSPLAPGLPISRRQAALLQEAIGQRAAQQSSPDIQDVLTRVLERHTQEVQAYFREKGDRQLALLRKQCSENLTLLPAVLQKEAELLRAVEQAAQGEIRHFVDEALPRLADVLASQELLLRCLQLQDGIV